MDCSVAKGEPQGIPSVTLRSQSHERLPSEPKMRQVNVVVLLMAFAVSGCGNDNGAGDSGTESSGAAGSGRSGLQGGPQAEGSVGGSSGGGGGSSGGGGRGATARADGTGAAGICGANYAIAAAPATSLVASR